MKTLATLALLAASAALPAFADSAASSASEGVSASVGSVSTSLQGSSNSSAPYRPVAAGDYRVVAMDAVADGRVRLSLQPLAGGDAGFALLLPAAAAAAGGVAAGAVVAVRDRPYGWAFAKAGAEPFFLVLDDAWSGELRTRAL